MTISTLAIYRNGVLQPAEPLPLAENQQVAVTIVESAPDADEVSAEEFFRLVDELAFDNVDAVLPADFSRADIYADHD